MTGSMMPLLVLAAIAIGYAILTNRLVKATEPFRYRAMRRAVELIRRDEVTDHHARVLWAFLDHMYDRRLTWRIALCFPWWMIRYRDAARVEARQPTGSREKIVEPFLLLLVAQFTLSPLAALLFALQLVILSIFGRTVQRAAGVIRDGIDRGETGGSGQAGAIA